MVKYSTEHIDMKVYVVDANGDVFNRIHRYEGIRRLILMATYSTEHIDMKVYVGSC
jgi:hypothetical protein